MSTLLDSLSPHIDALGRWRWPDPDCECVRMMRRAGRFRLVLTTWLEEQIAALGFPASWSLLHHGFAGALTSLGVERAKLIELYRTCADTRGIVQALELQMQM